MFVKLKNGDWKYIVNEVDVADIVEEYCGSDLADVIRNCDYTNIINNQDKAANEIMKLSIELGKLYNKDVSDEDLYNDIKEIMNMVDDIELLLEEYTYQRW